MRVLTVVGARPQFIKAAPVSNALREAGHSEFLVHTGQHYDYQMSQVFFDELGLARPDINLGVGSGSHGQQTGAMLSRIEEVLVLHRPDWVLVYGDTNSTLAGALAAAKLQISVAHVEAGLRSFNRTMPEEHNRILTDHCAELLLCPTQTAVEHLGHEGITRGVHMVGDTMLDAIQFYAPLAEQRSHILTKLEITPKKYLVATVHRPYNTDNPKRLQAIFGALAEIDQPVIVPVHPRTAGMISQNGLIVGAKVHLIQPLGYLDMLVLQRNANLILTDSGGVQKEAYFLAVPCATLRPETEWVETVLTGWNILVDANPAAILAVTEKRAWPKGMPPACFGDGHAAHRTVDLMEQHMISKPRSLAGSTI